MDNCISYRRLKGTAQHVIKSTAREYWQNYCSTMDKSTKLGSVWRMAHRMNGVNRERKIRNLTVNGCSIESNEEKAEAFAKKFSDISSNRNHNSNFLSRKVGIESNHTHLFDNISDDTNNVRLQSLNEPFVLHELRRVLREVKKQSAAGADKVSYEMLQNSQSVL